MIIRGIIVAAVLGLGAGVAMFMSGANVSSGKITVGTTIPPRATPIAPPATLYIPPALSTTTTTKPTPIHNITKNISKTLNKTVDKAGNFVTKTVTVTKTTVPHP